MGIMYATVFDWSEDMSLIDWSVRKWSAPGVDASIAAAFAIFSDAASSPSEVMMEVPT